MFDQPPSSDPQPSPQSEGLFCPNCEYDLTGLTEPRCPECGKPFDREELIRWKDPEARLNGPLLMGAPPGTIPFKRVLFYSFFAPRKLGRNLSPIPGSDTAWRYSVLTRAAMVCIILFVFFAVTGGEAHAIAVILSPIVVLGSIISEVLVAKMLTRYVPPQNVPPDYRYRFWRTVCQCYSGHLVVTCLIIGMWAFASLIIAGIGLPVVQKIIPMLFAALCVACGLWWWMNLGMTIAIWGGNSSARYIVILLIPVIASAGWLIVLLPLVLLCSVM